MEDNWRYINEDEGYNTKYLVSRDGRVYSILHRSEMKIHLQNGYPTLTLTHGLERKTVQVHRLVAKAFIPNNDFSLVVNHKNGITNDNNVENLEWVTPRENTQHAVDTGLKVAFSKRVSQYTKDGKTKIATFDSIKIAGEKTGYNVGHISNVARGVRKSTGGYFWKYEDEKDNPVPFDGQGIRHPLYPNYIIKSNGQIYSTITRHYLFPKITNGYHSITLRNNDGKKGFQVHRLVAEFYLTPDPDRKFVNHKDMDKGNNDVSNLEWVTQSENMIHLHANVESKSKKSVSCYTIDGTFLESYESIKSAGESTGADTDCIGAVCRGERLTAGGFLWRYNDPKEYEKKNLSLEIQKSILITTNNITSGNRKGVSRYTKDNILVDSFESAADAKRLTGICATGINKCCNGNQKTAGGSIWRFTNPI